jgi:hypothetical protein
MSTLAIHVNDLDTQRISKANLGKEARKGMVALIGADAPD